MFATTRRPVSVMVLLPPVSRLASVIVETLLAMGHHRPVRVPGMGVRGLPASGFALLELGFGCHGVGDVFPGSFWEGTVPFSSSSRTEEASYSRGRRRP